MAFEHADMIGKQFAGQEMNGDTPLNEIRVVFLGNGDVGKSHTIARLMRDGEKLDDTFTSESTSGIAIMDKIYQIDGEDIRVHFWDFGGQEIRYSLHRMFLTERTIYVVMVDTLFRSQSSQARDWLATVRSFAGGAPVLLVVNKMDQDPAVTIDERGLAAAYPNVKKILKMSALMAERERFNETFTSAMLELIRQSEWLKIKWPPSWRRVRDALQNLSKPYIHSQEYEQICRNSGVETGGDALLRWCNDLGICFACQDEGLRDYVILRPEWITNAVYAILFNKRNRVQNGLIALRDIFSLLNDKESRRVENIAYSWQDMTYVLDMLRKFQLSYSVDRITEFFPMLCWEEIHPLVHEYTDAPDTLEFHMKFGYQPNDVLRRVMNMLHRLVVERYQELDQGNVCRTGARFFQQGTGCSAVVAIDHDTLKFFVRYQDDMHRPNTYLSVLKSNVDRLWEEMGLPESESMVIYKEGGVAEAFSYEMLLRMKKEGVQEVFSKRRRRWLPISDILNQSAPEERQQTDKLLNDIAEACMLLQNQGMRRQTEDGRNRFLKDMLWNRGYILADQSLWGVSAEQRYVGEADLCIMDENRQPLTVIEALNISGSAASIRYWDKHLYKLLNNYNPAGLKSLFLIGYVECGPEKYSNMLDRFRRHMQVYSPERSRLRENSFEEIRTKEYSPHLKVAKCDYDFGGMTATVYHCFVWVGEAGAETSDSVKPVSDTNPVLPSMLNQSAEAEPEPVKVEPEPAQPAAEESALMEYRVVFLGDSEAGKSLILARLKSPVLEATDFSGDSTQGIDIYSNYETIKSNYESTNGQRVRVNYWDFGGQEILHSMHRMFLAKQTLYVIVLNTRNDNQDAQADFWLRYVETYAPGAPVLLVMNKIDQNPRAELNLPVLRRRFSRDFEDADVLTLSAARFSSEKFREAFKEKMLLCIAKCLSGTGSFTPQEARIRDKVREKKQLSQVISQDAFLDICEDEGLTDYKQQENLMIRFHEMGIMVFCGEGKPMLLNPEWITAAIYKVLEKRDDIARNGVVPHRKLRELFRKELGNSYESSDTAFVLAVMRAYGLSFLYEERVAGMDQTEDKEFIPMLCQRKEPEQIEELVLADETLELQLAFEYLPGGVLYQLLVDNHNALDKNLVWLTGAKFGAGDENYTIVRRDGNVMSIFAHNRNKEAAMEQLADFARQIEIIAEDLKYRAKLVEKKIGFKIADITEYFDYDRLVNAKSCELHYVASRISKKRIPVSDILDQGARAKERERDEMLRLILAGCKDIQKDDTFWDVDENARNRQLGRTLRQRYIVNDQTQGGKSGEGDKPGELDIEIRTDKDTPFAILEALNTTSVNTAKWQEHLDKLVDNYNTSGLPYLILVTYKTGSKKDFSAKCGETLEFWEKVNPSGFKGRLREFEPVCLADAVELISVVRADYVRNNFTVTLYHVMMHIGENKKVTTKKKSDTAENSS